MTSSMNPTAPLKSDSCENKWSMLESRRLTGCSRLRAIGRCLTAISLLLLSTPSPGRSETAGDRFFLTGDGHLRIKSDKTGAETEVDLLTPDGRFNEESFSKIDEVFEFPTSEKGEHISPRLIFMLDHFSDRVAPGRTIRMESGYRSPEYNTKLKNNGGIVAKTSLHLDGMALDFYIEGVNGKKLWDLVRSKECCGAGYYGGESIHLDSGRPRFWESDTAGTTTGDSDDNRRIHLSTDFDRYRAGDRVRLSFSSASDFGFGVTSLVSFVDDLEGMHTVATAGIETREKTGCVTIGDRKASRFLYVAIPPDMAAGRYRVRIDFCTRTSPRMPVKSVSNEMEIW